MNLILSILRSEKCLARLRHEEMTERLYLEKRLLWIDVYLYYSMKDSTKASWIVSSLVFPLNLFG